MIYIMVCDSAGNSISEGGDNAKSCMFYYRVLKYTGTESKKYKASRLKLC